jgi:hypothetical protein
MPRYRWEGTIKINLNRNRVWFQLAITALPPANVDLLVQMPLTFYMCTQIKNHRYIKPNTTVSKTGYKWETADT